jgi:hypothetical protein
MKLKRLSAILIVCALAVSLWAVPSSARLVSNANDDGYYKAYAMDDLSQEDFLKLVGINWFIRPVDPSFGGVSVISSSLPGGNWLDTEFGDEGAGKPITATPVEGEEGVYRVRHWSRGAAPVFNATVFEGDNGYALFALGAYWGTFEVVRYEWLDASGAVLPKSGAAPAPAPTPEPPPAPPADGELSTADALTILRIAAGLVEVTDELLAAYDLNEDGVITTADALIVLRMVAGV